MKLKQMNTRLRQYQSRLSKTIKTTLPVKVGALAKSHYQQNFREAGYVDGGLHPWKPAKRQGVARGASGRYTPLLSRRAYLMRSIRYEAGEGKVKVINDVPYAKIHNEGGTITSHPRVTPKMRKFAWAMYYKALGGKRRQGRAGKGKKTEQPSGNISAEAQRWKKLALSKKTQLIIPFLNEEDTCLCACVELKYIAVQAHYSQDTTAVCDILTQCLVASIVEATLRQDNRHTSTRFQEVEVTLYKRMSQLIFVACLSLVLRYVPSLIW